MLQPKRVNLENAPPSFKPHSFKSKTTITSRIRSSPYDPAGRRRIRTARSSKYATEQAKRKNKHKTPPTPVQFQVTSVSTAPQIVDVQMGDVDQQPVLTTQTHRLPRELLRPEFLNISKETLVSVEPDLGDDDLDIEYIRERVEEFGPGLLRTVISVVANPPKDSLPAEITISVNDSEYPPPTHMLAVHGRSSKDGPAAARRQVTLIPSHSLVLALHCARLPKLAPTPTPHYADDDPTQLIIPVQPLCLPSPAAFPLLSTFLYTMRADQLLKALLPAPPPPELDGDRALLPVFAARLARTYTAQALLGHVNSVHGLWQNACALGVFVDELWDTIDLAWEVLLTAMAISAGTPQVMLRRPSSPSPPAAPASEESTAASSSSTSDPPASAPTP
ncbi:hypothetical protein B0H10DRAFT_2217455 [Mycena sp. CBHHK59/15]|nr:hypothetical protein B0H10DRAFT_2217455 [Mycena sp. CBHHK59/15]